MATLEKKYGFMDTTLTGAVVIQNKDSTYIMEAVPHRGSPPETADTLFIYPGELLELTLPTGTTLYLRNTHDSVIEYTAFAWGEI